MKHKIPRDEDHRESLFAFTYLERENLWSGAGHIFMTRPFFPIACKEHEHGVLPWDTEELSTCSLG